MASPRGATAPNKITQLRTDGKGGKVRVFGQEGAIKRLPNGWNDLKICMQRDFAQYNWVLVKLRSHTFMEAKPIFFKIPSHDLICSIWNNSWTVAAGSHTENSLHANIYFHYQVGQDTHLLRLKSNLLKVKLTLDRCVGVLLGRGGGGRYQSIM